MSQSDYIRYKRVAVELKNQANNLAPVIDAGQYINYKAFTLENSIIDSKPNYNKIQPPLSVNVFGMRINNPSSCSTFQLCFGTNTRVNRKPLSGTQSAAKPLFALTSHKLPSNLNICKYC